MGGAVGPPQYVETGLLQGQSLTRQPLPRTAGSGQAEHWGFREPPLQGSECGFGLRGPGIGAERGSKCRQGSRDSAVILDEFPVEPANPRKRWSSVRLGGVGHSTTALTFLGSVRIRPPSTMCPRNSTEDLWNSHFSALTKRRFSSRRLSTRRTLMFLERRRKNKNVVQVNHGKYVDHVSQDVIY